MPVYQEKDKKKWTKDGRSWYYICPYIDMYGTRRKKRSKLYKTKSEAKDAEAEFLIKSKTHDEVDYDIKFYIVAYEWLDFKREQVKSPTIYGIKGKLQNHILSFFEKYKLHSIKSNVLKDWKNYLFKKDSLNLESKNKIIGYMQEILTYAVNNYDFDIKIASKLQKFKIEEVEEKINNAKTNFWTYDEFQKFISLPCMTEENRLIYKFLYYTGLRLGEMIALKWSDFDRKRKKIKVTKTFTNKVEGEKYKIITPKTKNSIREVDLDDDLFEELETHHQKESKIYNFNDNMFMFGNIKHIAPTTFSRHLDKYIEMANVKRITPHGFRHSHVSLLIYLKCDSRQVADRIGDTVQMVEKTYAHLFPEKKKETIIALNNLKSDKNGT